MLENFRNSISKALFSKSWITKLDLKLKQYELNEAGQYCGLLEDVEIFSIGGHQNLSSFLVTELFQNLLNKQLKTKKRWKKLYSCDTRVT